MKKKVLILAGGYSKEREISIKTAKAVFKQIKNDYKCKILDPLNGFIKDTVYCCDPVVTGVEILSVLPCNSSLTPNCVTAMFWLVSLLVNIALN